MFGKDGESDRQAPRQASVSATTQGSSSSAGARGGSGAIIGRSIQINGDVKGDEDLLIEGDVSGTVELKNHALTVGKEGKVMADIYARSITVDGTTEGDLYASERIAIRSSANVRGNLLAPRISLEDGAKFKGSVEMDQTVVEKALGASQAQIAKSAESARAKPNGEAKPAAGQPTAISAS